MRKHSRIFLVAVGIAVAAVTVWQLGRPGSSHPNAASAAVPVRVVQVTREDVPRYASGLGSVLSLHSVVVRPQIDGILTRLAVREGQSVKVGDLIATIDDRAIRATLERARAQLAQSQAQLDNARIDLARYRELGRDNGVSKQTVDQQQAMVNQLQATIQSNQADINAAQVQLSYTQIRSPVSGRVGIRNVDEGNFLRVSDAQGLISVTQIDPIAVEFSLPQQMLPTLQTLVAAHTPAAVQAWLGDGPSGQLLGDGTLTLIDNQVAASTGTIRAKAEFDNAVQKLWPGQLVTVKVQVGVERDALKVPPQVVQRGMDSHFAWRVRDGKVEAVPVTVLYQDSDQALISGVQAGDTLISDGQSRLRPGSSVEVLTAPEPQELTGQVEVGR